MDGFITALQERVVCYCNLVYEHYKINVINAWHMLTRGNWVITSCVCMCVCVCVCVHACVWITSVSFAHQGYGTKLTNKLTFRLSWKS